MTRTNSFTIKASLTTLLVIISFFCFYMSYSDFVKINNEYAYIYDDVDINYFDKKKFQKYYDIISIESLDDPIFDKEKSKSYFEISRNEVLKSKKFQDQYFIYHVVDVLKNPRITNSLSNPLSKIEKGEITMDPLIYQIKF